MPERSPDPTPLSRLDAAGRARQPPAAGVAGGLVGLCFHGLAADRAEPNLAHRFQFRLDDRLGLRGDSQWPARPAAGLSARSFVLRGRWQRDGRLEFRDDAPECVAGFRRGLYIGRLDATGLGFGGQYYELDESSHALYYWGDWHASARTD